MNETGWDERHFYFTLGALKVRIGISPVYTLVLPILNQKSPALRGTLLIA
jgi:hypothetical protein